MPNKMKYLKTPHERKSAALTTAIAILLLLIFSLVGLKYYDPPIEFGMEVNFGATSQGKGNKALAKPASSPKKVQVAPTPVKAEKTVKKSVSTPKKLLTQREASVPVAEKPKPKPKAPTSQKKVKKQTPEPTPKKEKKPDPVPEPPKPKVDDKTKSVLSNMLNAKKPPTKSKEGEGNDTVSGNKGKITGNPYASSYYTKAGLGGAGQGYGLRGRNLKSNGSVTQECNEEGIVVVRIRVNQNGEVVEAEAGVKGSTNVHPCLLAPAKQTAFLHQWFPDANAPDVQVGFVVVNFKLGE